MKRARDVHHTGGDTTTEEEHDAVSRNISTSKERSIIGSTSKQRETEGRHTTQTHTFKSIFNEHSDSLKGAMNNSSFNFNITNHTAGTNHNIEPPEQPTSAGSFLPQVATDRINFSFES